jgi:hypothetical protein
MRKKARWHAVVAPVLVIVPGLTLFLWMNRFNNAARLHEVIPWEYKWDMLKNTVLVYLVPFALVVALTLRRRRGIHPFAVAALLLVLATVVYWLAGYTAGSESGMFFSMFNAPRFALYGLMLAMMFVAVRFREGILMLVLLIGNMLLLPNEISTQIPIFITGKAYTIRLSQIEQLRRALPSTPEREHTLITDVPGYSVPAFSGYSQYNPYTRLFAIGTVDESLFAQRSDENVTFFTSMSSDQKLAFMLQNHLDTVVARRTKSDVPGGVNRDANFLPSNSATVSVGPEWVIYRLNEQPSKRVAPDNGPSSSH